MNDLVHLRAGEPLPAWVAPLEQLVFGDPWGPLEPHEHLLASGSVAFIRWSVVPAAGEAELLRIAVAPEARRRGLARRLLRESEPFLSALGITELFLEVRQSNASARSLYQAESWKELGTRVGYYRDGEDAVLYGKRLGR